MAFLALKACETKKVPEMTKANCIFLNHRKTMQALKLANIPEITFVDLYADDFRRENSNMGCSNKFRNPDDRKSQIIMRIQKTRQIELRTTLQSYNINNVSRFFFRFEENFALLLSGT